MPNGNIHDHPVTDIVAYGIPTYSPEVDASSRRSSTRLDELDLPEDMSYVFSARRHSTPRS
jgi:hypothetical protein